MDRAQSETQPLSSASFTGTCPLCHVLPSARLLKNERFLRAHHCSNQLPACTQISVAYFELYKEKVNDLIDQKNRDLPIRETRNGSITIPGLAKIPITTMAQFQVVLEDALSKRQVAATNLNSQSSRSHAILLVEVTKVSVRSFLRWVWIVLCAWHTPVMRPHL
jgi:hypothetical protein